MVVIDPIYDVIIVGGGPAGLSAALWCADLGLKAVVLEREPEFGGQLLHTFNRIENYIGIESTTGLELRDRFLGHVKKTSAACFAEVSIANVDLVAKSVDLADGSRLQAKAIIIATGVRRRLLEIPGETELAGRGILDSGVKNQAEVRGKTIAIVGGGDAALENAIILSETARQIHLIHRRRQFSARPAFIASASERPNVDFRFNEVPTSIVGTTTVNAVNLVNAESKVASSLTVDRVLIRIGVMPNTELFGDQLSLDGDGYVRTNAQYETTCPGIFAVGDAASPRSPTILSAVGQASAAAKCISERITR